MRILFATAEFAPLAIVGGLGSASSGLVQELRALGHDVEVVMPDYGDVMLEQEIRGSISTPSWTGSMTLRRGRHESAGLVSLIGSAAIARPHPYVDVHGDGWPDNDLRFFSFSAAVAALANEQQPDVVHVNDWHTSAALAWIDPTIATVLSIHNLAYQGAANLGWVDHFGDRATAFIRDGVCNPLAGGLRLARSVVVVSEQYRTEILMPEHAFGLHDVLAARVDALVGIRNGVETDVWNPESDPLIPHNYNKHSLDVKVGLRSLLRDELGLAPGTKSDSLAVVLSRLVDQKGIGLIVELAHSVAELPSQVAVLGAGDAALADGLRSAAADRPDRIAFVEGYESALGHRLLAGGDFLLMPSRFEPCGLTQMQAMRYGTIPIVSGVGGLVDTVIDADADRARGTGFVTHGPANVASLLDAWHRAQRAWLNAARRSAMQRRGMTADWSWRVPALAHIALYEHCAANA